MLQIVPVNRADIIEAQLFKERASGNERASKFFGLGGLLLEEARQLMGQLFGGTA